MRTLTDFVKELHPKDVDASVKEKMLKWTEAVENFAGKLYELTPDCPHRTTSARKLLEIKHAGIQAITHHGRE